MADTQSRQVAQAYAHCQKIVRSHYENFPVASKILPRALRQPISAIYAFARSADDFADEGDLDAHTRLAKLQHYDEQLARINRQQPCDDPIFIALGHSIHSRRLPISLFHDLITAFRQDVTKQRYASLDEIWEYSRYSANPVGRLLLHLIQADSAQNLLYSDDICSALQLINFLQDISQDLDENNRIYLPQDLMSHHGVNEAQLQQQTNSSAMQALTNQLIHAARDKMLRGKPLGRAISGRFGFQLRMMINGGLRILERLEQEENAFARPRLRKRDWLWILHHAL